MRIRQAEHQGPADLGGMQELAQRVFPLTGYRAVGDLAWSYALTYDQPQANPTALWRDGGRVVAWGWLQLPGELMLQADPDYAGLADEVLAWAESLAAESLAAESTPAGALAAGPLSVIAADTETAVIAALTRRGYTAQDAPFFACLSMPLPPPPRAWPLPDGYRIRAVAGEHELGRRAAVHRSAFTDSQLTTGRYRHLVTVPSYRPELDLVAEAPDGELAAYCLGWYDEHNATGELEPVGTHPDHRRRGLAQAVNSAVLAGFAAAGGTRAIVNARGDAAYPAPKRLYESLGFRQHTRTRAYARTGA